MENDIMQIIIDGRRIGMVGLRAVFKAVQLLEIEDPAALGKKLVSLCRERNYLPSGSEKKYEQALLREYRRFTGQPVEEEKPVPEILILGRGCVSCDELHRRVLHAACEMGLAVDIRHEKDPREILKYGVVPVPALVVNGSIKSAGKVLHEEKIKQILQAAFG